MRRRIASWAIPLSALVLLGLLLLGVRVADQYRQEGEFFTPAQPIAGEPAKFHYLIKADTGQPVQEAALRLSVSKIKKANPFFFTSYLPEGPILNSPLYSRDGRLNFEAIFWDEGTYLLSLESDGVQGRQDSTRTIPFKVKPPLATYRNDLLLVLALMVAGFIGGMAGARFKTVKPSFRKVSFSTIVIFAAGLFALPVILVANENSEKKDPSRLPQPVRQAGDGQVKHEVIKNAEKSRAISVKWEMNPPRPVAGESVTLTASVMDLVTGNPISESDASLTITHREDHLDLLKVQDHLRGGTLVVNYVFPEGADYLLSLYVAPTPRSSRVFYPFTSEEAFSVEPKGPDVWAQVRAFLLLSGLGWTGMALGFVYERRKGKTGLTGKIEQRRHGS